MSFETFYLQVLINFRPFKSDLHEVLTFLDFFKPDNMFRDAHTFEHDFFEFLKISLESNNSSRHDLYLYNHRFWTMVVHARYNITIKAKPVVISRNTNLFIYSLLDYPGNEHYRNFSVAKLKSLIESYRDNCDFCGKNNAAYFCKRCGSVRYCNVQCQKSDWNLCDAHRLPHSAVCYYFAKKGYFLDFTMSMKYDKKKNEKHHVEEILRTFSLNYND
jgi:hypothetical protein